MANADAPALPAAPISTAKTSFGSLLIVAGMAGVLAVAGSAGTLLYLSKSGRLGAASAAQPQVVVREAAAAEETKNVSLEPLLVNLADEDGHAYLRLGVVLAEEVDKDKKAEKEEKPTPGADAAVRDVILGILGRKHAGELLTAAGKEALKRELHDALAAQVPKAKVRNVYFTDFLVQR